MSEPATIEGTAHEHASAEVVAYSAASTAIVAGATAAERLAAATEIATQLDDVIKTQGLRTRIGRRKITKGDRDEWVDNFHIDIEAWQTVAAFLGMAPVPVWTRRVIDPATGEPERVTYEVRREIYAKGTKKDAIKDGTAIVERVEAAQVDGYSWEARVEVYKDGALVSAGEAMCSRTEESWRSSSDHDVRSMAATRAARNAIAGVAKWVITLAGYRGAPETAPPGSQASDELRQVTDHALAYLLDGDVDATDAVTEKLAGQFEGTLPANALQAILIVAKAVKDARERLAANGESS